MLYLLYGLLDRWFVPAEHQTQVWVIRLIALFVPTIVFALTFTRWFERISHLSLALIGLAAGIGFLAMFSLIPLEALSLYYPGMVLVTFFTYNLVGTRFIYAVCVDIVLLISFNLFAIWKGYPLPVLMSHDFFIICANLIGGAAGYHQEYQNRQLFLRELELDNQRREHLARSLHDRLTGLANRELLHDRMTQALAHATREGASHTGFFIDLDGFKQINDQLGHEVGDRALKAVADSFAHSMRETDTVSRLGGNEFFVLAYGINNVEDIMKQADKILSYIQTAFPEMSTQHRLSASIGICQFPYDGATVADIIRRADQAMYSAKKAGKGRVVIAAKVHAPEKLLA